MVINSPARELLPVLRGLLSASADSWKREGFDLEVLIPAPEARVINERDLEMRFSGSAKFPFDGDEAYFVLPKIPRENEFVAYLTFEWTDPTKGGFRVYFVNRRMVRKHRKGRAAPAPAFVVRYETANTATWTYVHAQASNSRFSSDYARLPALSPKLVPNGAPHLPLHSRTTAVSLLITLVGSLYGHDSLPYRAVASVEGLTEHERDLLKWFAPPAAKAS